MSDTTANGQQIVEANITLDTSNPPVVMSRRDLVRGLATGAVVAFAGSGCAENPATGRSQLILISDGQLAQLAASSWTQIKRQERVSRDPRKNAQVQRVGRRIASAAGMSNLNWEFTVFESDELNAFVLPGGKVGFYSGIMDIMSNDDQVAVVMGHEAGHVAARHAAERFSQSTLANIGLQATAIALEANDVRASQEIAAVLGLGLQFGVLLPYSRVHEHEADALGVRYMHRAGYNGIETINFWNKMISRNSGRSRPPEYLSTHPAPENRMAQMRQQLRNLGYNA